MENDTLRGASCCLLTNKATAGATPASQNLVATPEAQSMHREYLRRRRRVPAVVRHYRAGDAWHEKDEIDPWDYGYYY